MIQTLQECSRDINSCSKCAGMCEAIGPYGQETGLNYVEPIVPVEILFVAEAPPSNEGNYFYAENATNTNFRKRLFNLINKAGLKPVDSIFEFNSRGYFLADIINCRWEKNKEKVKQPTPKQLEMITSNCLIHLENQLKALKPQSVVFIGKLANIAGKSEKIMSVIEERSIPDKHIIHIPTILHPPKKIIDIAKSLSALKELNKRCLT